MTSKLPNKKIVRRVIKAYLAESTRYDADSMHITVEGDVTAKPDRNKNPGCDTTRLLVGGVRELYTAAVGGVY